MAKRDYKREWLMSKKKYDAKPSVRAKRNSRKKARYAMQKAGKVRPNDGKDVDHKNRNANDNRPSNLRIVSQKKNRGWSKGLSIKRR